MTKDRHTEMRLEQLKSLLASEQGRSFLAWLLDISNGEGVANPFNGNALGTSFNCGTMNVGLQIKAEIVAADPQGYVKLLQERADAAGTRSEPEPD